MNVEKYNEDQEIKDRELDEDVDLVTMNRDADNDFAVSGRLNGLDEEDELNDFNDEYEEDDYEEVDDLQLGMYFDEPPRPYQRWKKPKRKRSHHSSYSPRRFRWDNDEDDQW